MKKIIEVGSDEDGETYFVVGNVTELGAKRALKKYLREWGIVDEVNVNELNITRGNFWQTIGGSYDGWIWWSKPNPEKYRFGALEPLGVGWIFKV